MRGRDMREHALPPPAPQRPWMTGGLAGRQETIFRWATRALLLFMAIGWTVSVIEVRHEVRAAGGRAAFASPTLAGATAATRSVTAGIVDPRASKTAFIDDAMLEQFEPLHGESGEVHVAFRTPGEAILPGADDQLRGRFTTPSGSSVESPDLTAPSTPGIYKIAVELGEAQRDLDNISLITLVPFSEKQGGRIGLYYLGSWPYEGGGKPRTPAYANPRGFIEVTPQNRNMMISDHFKLGDFLTKDQPNVWPKYLLLQPKLLDKLELVIDELEREGHPVRHMQIMSGFRTPNYNVRGGNTAGRANLSRHMYGDASDVFVDNDGNGMMDDLNHDGRVDVGDAEVIKAAAEAVERRYPALVGGIGVYVACCGHGPFTHIDVRGYAARWRGTGNG